MSDEEWISNEDINNSPEEEYFSDHGFNLQPSKRAHVEIDSKVHGLKEFENMVAAETNQLENVLAIARPIIKFLLMRSRWNKDKVIESYVDDKTRFLIANGILIQGIEEEDLMEKEPQIQRKNTFTCPICYNDEENQQVFSLLCGHCYCLDCYSHYCQSKIQEGDIKTLKCPAEKCTMYLLENNVKTIVDSNTFQKYSEWYLRNFIDDIEYYKWCPTPDCNTILECHIPSSIKSKYVPALTCNSCNSCFCFSCMNSDHTPLPCYLLKQWNQKCKDDSETSNWLSANTKDCPKCQSSIEKNGGCNHMTCKRCTYQFCWVCMGDWKIHVNGDPNRCNRYQGPSELDSQMNDSRAALERYLFYFERYHNHEKSVKLEKDILERTEKKMEEIQVSTDLSWIEVQFFKKAVTVLAKCRSTLKYTYAFAYYLQRNNATELFECNQGDLEMAVEQLAQFIETPIVIQDIPSLRQKVLDKTVYVESRKNVLLDDIIKGFLEDRWIFLV